MANQTIQIKTRYTHKKAKPTSFSKTDNSSVSKTQQHFREDCNINSIIKKYNTSGLLTDPAVVPTRQPMTGDMTGVVDFHTMQNKMIEMRQYFKSIPAIIRKRFGNDPDQLLAWINNPDNKSEAIELGLLPRDLSNVRYFKTLQDGSEVDITEEVIANRGLFVDGKRVNKDGTPYIEAVQKTTEVSPEP